ncbi:MAG: type VI secretion system protein TssA [Thermodesulfobacteriota bacterium]
MEILELGKTPISAEQPAGEDARYEPEFEELQAEIDKMSVATAGGAGINWARVLDLSTRILGEKSKNIQVAAYLGAALIETRKLEGFGLGLVVLKDLVENFWETMYPPLKRKRGRFNAVTWWMDRCEAFFDGFTASPLPEEEAAALKENLAALDSALSSKDEEAPMVTPKLRDLVARLPVIPKEAPPAEAVPAAPTAAPAAPGAPVDQVGSSQDAEKLIEFGLTQLAKVAEYYLNNDPANPLAYRLNRVVAWLPVDGLPAAEGGRTLLAPPDPAVRNAFDNLWTNKEYQDLVQGVEARVGEFLFWLDLSRISAQALEEMGGQYRAAAAAVALETALYVGRLPGLAKLTFSDGTPFADGQTKAWLQTIAPGGGAEEPAAPGLGGVDAALAEAVSQAQSLMKDGQKEEAVRLLSDGLARVGSGQARLTWRMALTRFLQTAGLGELAKPNYDLMLDQLDEFRLEEWNPSLALGCLKLVYEGLADDNDDEVKAKARRCLDRIARINPAEAMSLWR